MGMVELLQIVGPLCSTLEFELHVVGTATEGSRPLADYPGVTLHGRVSDDRLEELMATSKAAIVHQRAGAGTLTRITELLVAGVPVIANVHAARIAYHYEGVHLYEREEELASLISSDLPTPPVPPRPAADESRVIEAIRRLAGAADGTSTTAELWDTSSAEVCAWSGVSGNS